MASVRIHNQFNSRYNLGASRLVLALALFLVLSVDSWGACESVTQIVGTFGGYVYSTQSSTPCASRVCDYECSECQEVYQIGGYYYGDVTHSSVTCDGFNAGCNGRWCGYRSGNCLARAKCDSRCDVEELKCNAKGWDWDAENCRCSDPSICGDYRSQCEEVGGIFHGLGTSSGGQNCCRASCNVCGGDSFKKLYDMKRQICCDRMQAPPNESSVCKTVDLPPATCGMVWSQYSELTSNEWACRDPNLSQEAAQNYYEQCFEPESSSSDDPNSSGSGESSGSGGGDYSSGSGTQYPEGCDECPWLDSILDTLTLQKQAVDAIYNCIMFPGLCSDNSTENNPPVPIDSSAVPLLDSANRLSEKQIYVMLDIDSLLEKINKKDSLSLLNDSNLVSELYFVANVVSIQIGSANDTTRKWFRRIADSIGVSTDSLISHIDSIKNNIPKDVLDSILKYQKLFAESDDSLVVGSLPSLDSLIDSSLKYWKMGLHYDSLYYENYSDSLRTIHDAISDIGNGVGYALGYGDTASTNLRGDLDGIKDGITDFRDSAIKYLSNISIDGDYQGTVTSGLESIGNSVDALPGRIANSIDSALSAHGGGSVDTSGVHMDIFGGEFLADSIARDIGYDKINVGRDTSAMDSIERLGYVETDSTLCVGSECITYDSESRIADSAQRYIAVQGDSLRASNAAYYKDSVDAMFQEVKDTLSKWNPFGMFDSTLMKTLGAKVPNSNTCPEHCSKYRVDIPFIFANLGIDLDWQLCASWAVLGGQNVMSFLRFIIRVIVAVTCIAMVMNAAANTKVK